MELSAEKDKTEKLEQDVEKLRCDFEACNIQAMYCIL